MHREIIEHRLTKNPHDVAYAIMLCKLAIKELDKINAIFEEAFKKCEQDIAEGRALPRNVTREKILDLEISSQEGPIMENGPSARSLETDSSRREEGILVSTSD